LLDVILTIRTDVSTKKGWDFIMKKGVSAVLSLAAGAVSGAAACGAFVNKQKKEEIEVKDKLYEFYVVLNQWLSIHQEGKTLVDYFKTNGYKTVAIYGMKELGERLYDELKDSEIEVKYVIDKNADAIYADVEAVTPDEELEPVDVIVVTAIHYFDEIDDMLSEKVEYPIVSLEDIVYEV